jgi:Protein of unknown function (DUF4232)
MAPVARPGRIRTLPVWIVAPLGCVLLMVESGCGGTSKAEGPRPPIASTSPTTHPTIPPSTTTSSIATPVSSGEPTCKNGQVTVADGGRGAGLGHVDQVILFANDSRFSCTLTGYPGIAGLGSRGQQETEAKRTLSGFTGGLWNGATTLPLVSLAPSQEASAIVEGIDFPVGTETSCPLYGSLLVTPPNLTHSVRLALSDGMPGCSTIEVHPVVPGTSGIIS